MTYKPVIGIETHIQLNTQTKLFCSCLNEYAPDQPNKNICPFCTGQPGALPLLNKSAVEKALILGVALNGKIPNKTRWDRKNYFYPDLPAGYQISQYDNPIIEAGELMIWIEQENGETYTKLVQLERAHLEADAGKLLHVGSKSLVDYNRSGAPLIEAVTAPVLEDAPQAMAYVQELQTLVRKLGISEASMDKGNMRFDCNISLRNSEEQKSGKLPGYKVEIKNINSLRSLGRAIEHEIQRQIKILDGGDMPVQETRGWRDDLNKSESQRSKEDAQDYRYFPEPDLRILEITASDIPSKSDLPELPGDQRLRYLESGISFQNANTFVLQDEVGNYYDNCLSLDLDLNPKTQKTLANIITTNLIGIANKNEIQISDILTPEQLLETSVLFADRKINNQGLTTIIEAFAVDNQSASLNIQDYVNSNGLVQVTDDSTLEAFVELVIQNNQGPIEQYKNGKLEVIRFLVGQCMKESKGKGDPARFKELLEVKLHS